MAKIVDIADAVVTRLNEGPFSLPFTASRTYAPLCDLSTDHDRKLWQTYMYLAKTHAIRSGGQRATRRRAFVDYRSNRVSESSAEALWTFYIQLTEVEAAFKTLKDDLALRPIHHQLESRIEAHIFIAFLAYCLHVTLHRRLRDLAPGLTPRAVLEKFATIQMLDVLLPTTDGRLVVLTRYTNPETDVNILLQRLKLELPPQPPPRITATPPKGGPVL